jgi:hypothetical protein
VAEQDAPASERAAVLAATLGVGALVAQQIAGKATRDALFLQAFDVRALPLTVAASALLLGGGGAAVLAGDGAPRAGPRRARGDRRRQRAACCSNGG